ncbi:hypothetical protein KX75_20040 [Salmonella enterica subsp. enterica]|nr:hypothetical protein [Salmonella enterica subsp. enterica serovar Mikawasima]EDN7229166.1 hypothetical protein [Salmonella enterica subsp. enterica serovar Mikawasima]
MAEKTGLSLADMEGPVREPGDDRYGFRAIAEGLARNICALCRSRGYRKGNGWEAASRASKHRARQDARHQIEEQMK